MFYDSNLTNYALRKPRGRDYTDPTAEFPIIDVIAPGINLNRHIRWGVGIRTIRILRLRRFH